MAAQQNYNPERQYKCKFFIDENDFIEVTQHDKKVIKHPFSEKDMFLSDVPKGGEVILISLNANNNIKANLYQIEIVYKHICGGVRASEVEVSYRILMKQLYVATRIVMVEKYKAPVLLPNNPHNPFFPNDGGVNRNYYYEAEDDDYEIAIDEIDTEEIEVNDAFTQMPF